MGDDFRSSEPLPVESWTGRAWWYGCCGGCCLGFIVLLGVLVILSFTFFSHWPQLDFLRALVGRIT